MTTKKINFLIRGEVRGVGFVYMYKHAKSKAQALRIVSEELKRTYPKIRIYTGNLTITAIRRSPKNIT